MRTKKKKSLEDVVAIVKEVRFMDRTIHVERAGSGFLVQVQYFEEDVETGRIALQKARQWYLSPFASETEIVETCFKAVRTSMEHVVKEHFSYKKRRVYSPHFAIDGRISLCDGKWFDP